MRKTDIDILKQSLPDYHNCLVNLANSVLENFGAKTTANTLPAADEFLTKDYKNVVVLLLDGLGASIMEKHLDEDGFFRSHKVCTYDSVYPPTTVAATTSVMSGLYPNEHGWLGWDMYYPGLGQNVTVFLNSDQLVEKENAKPYKTDEQGNPVWGDNSLKYGETVAPFNAGYEYTPYQNIVSKIREAGGNAYFAMPFAEPYPDTLEEIFGRVKELCATPDRKFIYAYWNEPDHSMHANGTKCDVIHQLVADLEKKVQELAEELTDTLLIVTADHSHIDSRNLCILDYPEVMNCLVRMPSIEPRTLNLFVKPEYLDSASMNESKELSEELSDEHNATSADDRTEKPAVTFLEIFKRNFGDDWVLLSRQEVLDEHVFGPEADREGLEDLIGDYVAFAVSDATMFYTHYEAQETKGIHAGLTTEEIKIPLIVIEK